MKMKTTTIRSANGAASEQSGGHHLRPVPPPLAGNGEKKMEQTQEHIAEATRRVEKGEYGAAAQLAVFGPGYHGKVVYEGGHHVVVCFAANKKPLHIHYDEAGAIIRRSGCWCQTLSPTPWTVRYVDGKFPQWVDANGEDVPPTKEQAERVRDAVNNHERLDGAIGKALDQIESGHVTEAAQTLKKALGLREAGKDGA